MKNATCVLVCSSPTHIERVKYRLIKSNESIINPYTYMINPCGLWNYDCR